MKRKFVLPALAAMAALALVFTGCDPESDPVLVKSVTVSPSTPTLDVGETVTLAAVVAPADADNTSYTWGSSDETVATVSTSGVVTAVAAGTATITATASDGGGAKGSATITVNATIAIAGDGFDIDEEQAIKLSELAAAPQMKIAITSRDGIENFLVDIDGATLDEALTAVGLGGEFDLANPDEALAASLAGLGQAGITLPSGDALKGKKEYSFDLTSFIPMIAGAGEGSVAFKITVKDAAEHAVTKTLTVTIVDDMKLAITGSVGETPIEIKMSDALAEPIAIDPVAVDIVADQGIENFMVEIDSSSNAFKAALTLFHITGAFDLANPGETLAGSLTTVGLLNPETPVKGATEMTFDVTEFIPLIFQVRSQMSKETGDFTASFKLTITDGAGQTKEATIALNLVDDSAAGEGDEA